MYDWQTHLFIPVGQQDVYDKTGNNNTVEVSAKLFLSPSGKYLHLFSSVGGVLCVCVCS